MLAIDLKPAAYQAPIAIPPGETIAELLEVRTMTQNQLATRMGRTDSVINQLIRGKKSITPETAIQLERVLGLSSQFWVRLEADYQATKARLNSENELESQTELLDEIPYSELVRRGFVHSTSSRIERTRHILEFLQVASMSAAKDTFSKYQAAARRGGGTSLSPLKLALWIRSGEREFDGRDLPPFNMESIQDSLSRLRLLVRDTNVASATEDLIRICYEAGIAIAFVPEFKSFPLHGITYWRGNTPHVYVNIRGRYHDIFWFTIFHELGHVLLHNNKQIFVDVEKASRDSAEEIQADRFASDVLIPPDEYELYINKHEFTTNTIINFARKIRTHPGVVVGRLKHDGYIKWNQLNNLRMKLEWDDNV